MHKLKALIFDVDGTLADTESAHLEAFNRIFQQFDLDWHWDRKLYLKLLEITGGKERIKHYLNHYPVEKPKTDNLDKYIAEMHQKKTEIYNILLTEGQIKLRPGVERLIREAKRQGMHLAIATTTSHINVKTLFKETVGESVLEWFEVVIAGENVVHKKPDPEVYLNALKALGLAPSECLAIEDSELGVRSASGAGINTIVTINPFTEHHDFSSALLVLDNLGEPQEPMQIIRGKKYPESMVTIEFAQMLCD